MPDIRNFFGKGKSPGGGDEGSCKKRKKPLVISDSDEDELIPVR